MKITDTMRKQRYNDSLSTHRHTPQQKSGKHKSIIKQYKLTTIKRSMNIIFTFMIFFEYITSKYNNHFYRGDWFMRITKVLILWTLCFVFSGFSAQFGTLTNIYREQDLVKLPSTKKSISTEVCNFSDKDTIQQSFIIRPQDPLAEKVLLQYIFLSTYFWAGSGAELSLAIYEGDLSQKGALLFEKQFETLTPDVECGMTYPEGTRYFRLSDSLGPLDTLDTTASAFDSEGLELTVGKQYTFAIIADSISERSFGFYKTTEEYPDGSCSDLDSDIWFKMSGKVDSRMDSTVQYSSHASNTLYFDTYSYIYPTKLLGENSTERVHISHPFVSSFSYLVENPTIVSVAKESDAIALTGLAEGDTRIFITDGADTLSLFEVSVRKKRRIDVSLSYVKYPGELEHPMMSAFDEMTTEIAKTYDSINVDVHFVDKGIYEWDWDLNGDSSSYTVDYKETKSPVDSGVLTEMDEYFSNLYLIRDEKSDSSIKTGQNGGGSSMGMGSEDFPRAAYKRIHLNQTIQGIMSTLGHELAHNLGVSHYSQMNTMYYPTPNPEFNIMKTGRVAEKIYSFQWRQIHQTIQECFDNGEIYEDKTDLLQSSPDTNNKKVTVNRIQNKLRITGLSPENTMVQIFDLRGRELFNTILQEGMNLITLPQISNQVVSVVVKDANQKQVTVDKILIGR